jgi:hypothetical protein
VIRRSEVRIRVSRDLGFGQLDLGSRASAASRNLIGPRAVRWYKASPLPGLDRNSRTITLRHTSMLQNLEVSA